MNSSLRIAFLANMLALMAGSGTALMGKGALVKARQHDAESCVKVYILRNAGVPFPTLLVAQLVAREMFAKAGVNLKFQTGEPKLDAARRAIVIDMAWHAPERFSPSALAYAQEFEGVHITVFYDRVEAMAGGELVQPLANGTLAMLLAHVLVHEITHILEGTDRHSQQGVMKAHWTAEDVARMAKKPLPFDHTDIELIHLGLARRENARNATLALNR
jgi:hypothetical protein